MIPFGAQAAVLVLETSRALTVRVAFPKPGGMRLLERIRLICQGQYSLTGCALGISVLMGCNAGAAAGAKSPKPEGVAGSDAIASANGNPFAGIEGYIAPYGFAEQAYKRLLQENPEDAALIEKIALQPQGKWFGGWSTNINIEVANYVKAAARKGKLPVMVAYNVPNRDCGQYSQGGASDPEVYRQWVRDFAEGIGDNRAVVILEPDAIPQLAECLNEEDQAQRLELIQYATEAFDEKPGTAVYIDGGHSDWQTAAAMADRLKRAGVAGARGFSLNVSNYRVDEQLIAYGNEIVKLLGTDTHYIIDSSRNGNGSTDSTDAENWCNPEGRALGRAPTTHTGEPLLDAFQWVKKPGESDGECKGGPAAGLWFEQRALEMARNASW